MDKLKEKLHIGSSKSKDVDASAIGPTGELEGRESYDSELEGMTPEERIAYLKEFEHAEKHGEPKKGSFLDRLIARGNKKTEDEIAEQQRLAQQKQTGNQQGDGVIR